MLSQQEQAQLGDTALGIYDKAFISMSYLRSAQSIVLSVSRDLAAGEGNVDVHVDQLQSALDALDVARERAMSPRGEHCAGQLQVALSALQLRLKDTTSPPARRQFLTAEQMFDVAVDIYATDGFRLRRSVEALVAKTRFQTYAAIIASVMTAFVITLMLSRAIVPSIRHAVRIAAAIAAGRLDNRIERGGASETGLLLQALGTMQDSIADKIARIEDFMAQQASSHAIEIACQHARFEAALNNMTLGLCMFDSRDVLLVHNRRFVEMFVPEGARGDVAAFLPSLGLVGPDRSAGEEAGSRSFSRLLDDGRTISVREEPMDDGGRVVTYEDVTERHRAEARLFHMSRHDALTGLPNRTLFREHLEEGMKHVGQGGVLSLLCLDLDRFKTVNDTMGHPVGDALLREAATRLLDVVGETDLVARLGGDEFAVIRYSERSIEEAQCLAKRLTSSLGLPFDIDGQRVTVGASIGIAETNDPCDTPDGLLKNADLALYLAKAQGRGIFRFFEREMEDQVQEKHLLELDMRASLAARQFELHYQPLLSTASGQVVAFEALLRWHHPRRGMVSPAQFIPLAEETGIIPELGLWVLNQACSDAMHWPESIKVAVNLSPLQFRSAALVADVAAALRSSGLPASRLELEITESLMLQDTDTILTMLRDLRALGIRISMDDFGTGYSSLSYLRRFPFDKIKIDQSFIRNMSESGDELAIVRAVIGLGESLRMNVVAEGVETQEQMDLLCNVGCQEVQGYLFSRPQPAAAVLDLIDRFK